MYELGINIINSTIKQKVKHKFLNISNKGTKQYMQLLTSLITKVKKNNFYLFTMYFKRRQISKHGKLHKIILSY